MATRTLPQPALPLERPHRPPGCPRRLDQAPHGRVFTVLAVQDDPRSPGRALQLEEIGFFPGEQVKVMMRGRPGGDPIVVRIGQSTFALRCAEAACIQLEEAGVPA